MYAAGTPVISMPAQPSPSRLEAFSDGVIAVIITIMVLDLKVPRADGLAGFVSILPTLAVYLLSFLLTGIYWVNHHHLIDRLKIVDHLILWSNLAFLFCLSLLPFFTNYLIEKHLSSFSVAIYAASLLLDGLAFTLLGRALIRHILRHSNDYAPQEASGQVAETYKGLFSIASYTAAIPLALWFPRLALLLIAIVTFIWIVPTFGVQPHDCAPPHPTG